MESYDLKPTEDEEDDFKPIEDEEDDFKPIEDRFEACRGFGIDFGLTEDKKL
jgi:hypothetical protein